MSCRIAATRSCSGTRRNWAALCKRCHDAKTAREGRWGVALRPPGGGEVIVYEMAGRDRAGRRAVYAREIQ